MTRQGLREVVGANGKWRLIALAAFLGMQVSAQTQSGQAATPSFSAEQQTSSANPPMPGTGKVANQPDSALPATAPLGHNMEAPSAPEVVTNRPSHNSMGWQTLSKRQKQALAPLAGQWHELTAQQRQKWLTLSKNFLQLSDEEQLTLHARMREWAALSPRQRSQARFHFNATQSLSAQDKRAQWEAYQALSEQEKNKLASGPKPPVKSTARSFAPPNTRLVSPPLLPVNATRAIQRVAPSKPIHPKTLLPQPS